MYSFTKQPAEETTVAVDFAGYREFQGGETIASVVVSITQEGESYPDMLVSHAAVGNTVRVRVRGGSAGLEYIITVLATTNQAHRREADVHMFVQN